MVNILRGFYFDYFKKKKKHCVFAIKLFEMSDKRGLFIVLIFSVPNYKWSRSNEVYRFHCFVPYFYFYFLNSNLTSFSLLLLSWPAAMWGNVGTKGAFVCTLFIVDLKCGTRNLKKKKLKFGLKNQAAPCKEDSVVVVT